MVAIRRLIVVVYLACHAAQASSACDTIRISGGESWFPFFFNQLSTQDAKQLGISLEKLDKRRGIVGDIVQEALQRTGVRAEFDRDKPWRRSLFELERGQVDVIAGALKTPSRERIFDFSIAVYHSELRVFVRQGKHSQLSGMADLQGKRGLKIGGMSLGSELDEYAFEHLVLEETTTTDSLFKMLAANRVDYGIVHYHSGLQHIAALGLRNELRALPLKLASEPIYVLFNKKPRCPKAIQQLRREIEDMLTDGSLNRITAFYDQLIRHNNDARLPESGHRYAEYHLVAQAISPLLPLLPHHWRIY